MKDTEKLYKVELYFKGELSAIVIGKIEENKYHKAIVIEHIIENNIGSYRVGMNALILHKDKIYELPPEKYPEYYI